MKTLDLVLKGKWYDMIESGEKKEEYREIKPYWCNRLLENMGIENWNLIFIMYPIWAKKGEWLKGDLGLIIEW